MKEITGCSETETVINKSRFIGYVCAAATEEKAIEKLNERKKQYSDATHNCYAYIIGQNSGIMRYSDAGEPQGTAGIPILEVLKKNEICNILAVVTRYFGGILLGSGGLIRAYTKACSDALSGAQITDIVKTDLYKISLSYAAWEKCRDILNKNNAEILNLSFNEDISLQIKTEQSISAQILDFMREYGVYNIEKL